MQLEKAIRLRKSVRRYSSKVPDWRDIIECIDSARYAPMAGNNFTLRFVLVSDKDKILKLGEASQQSFVAQAKYVVVIYSDTSRTVSSFEERGDMYSRQQAGAAIQNIILRLVEKKLATCWVGHFVDSIVKETLSIPENFQVEAMLPIGYESPLPKQKQKQKLELDRVLYFNKHGNKYMRKIPRVEA